MPRLREWAVLGLTSGNLRLRAARFLEMVGLTNSQHRIVMDETGAYVRFT